MAKWVVSYYILGDGSVPDFIAHGGGDFPIGNELVGVSIEDTERYLPSTVTKLTRAQLLARATAVGFKHDKTFEAFTDQEVIDYVTQYLSNNGLSDYA